MLSAWRRGCERTLRRTIPSRSKVVLLGHGVVWLCKQTEVHTGMRPKASVSLCCIWRLNKLKIECQD